MCVNCNNCDCDGTGMSLSKYKGEKGDQGDQGIQGDAGTDGINGISIISTVINPANSQELLITYSDNSINTVAYPNPSPAGIISMWSGAIGSIPTGWALCDGTNNTPDLSGKFIVGFDPSGLLDSGDYAAVGNTGGASSVALTTTQMPSHSHQIYTTEGGATTGANEDALNVNTINQSDIAIESVTPSGAGLAHENRPSFYTLAYIIKQ